LIGLAVLLVAAAGVGIGLGVSGSDGGHSTTTGTRGGEPVDAVSTQAVVTTLTLSKSDKYSYLAVVGNRIALYGPSTADFPETGATCSSAVVNPSTLVLGDLRSGSCANPSLEGERVLPVMSPAKTLPRGGIASYAVRVAHVTPASPGYQLGPVVMTFTQGSSSSPVWVYGEGSLWLYDSSNPGGTDLFRISETTGVVLQALRVPAVARPILGVDDDGLWIAPAANSLGADDAVYHVALGASAATSVFPLSGGEYVAWMVATGHTVLLAVKPGAAAPTLWRLTGASARRSSHVRVTSFDNDVEVQGGSSAMVGDASMLWTAVSAASGKMQRIVRLNPNSGAWSAVASLDPGYATTNEVLYTFWQAVTYRGSVFLLDPPNNAGAYPHEPEGFSALYRITPRAR
jgi:hypothetical protein